MKANVWKYAKCWYFRFVCAELLTRWSQPLGSNESNETKHQHNHSKQIHVCGCVWVWIWLCVEQKQRHKYMNSIIYFNPVLMVCKHFVCSSSHFQLGCSYFIHLGAFIFVVCFMCWICVFISGFYDGKTFANANKNRIASNLLLVWLRVFVRVVFLSSFFSKHHTHTHRITLWMGRKKRVERHALTIRLHCRFSLLILASHTHTHTHIVQV